jgi:hypothetical protein
VSGGLRRSRETAIATRIFITVISAAIGACFTMLAALSIKAAIAPVRRFHASSVVVAAVTICLAFLAFRAAAVAETDEETLLRSLWAGMVGAFVALIITIVGLFAFGDNTRSLLAHAFSYPTSSFTTSLLLIASMPLGFGAGLVLRIAAPRSSKLK